MYVIAILFDFNSVRSPNINIFESRVIFVPLILKFEVIDIWIAKIMANLENMENLREEITQALNARKDLLKWKFIVIAALGAAGLGIQSSDQPMLPLLCLIPLVCVYVDLLCKHLKLRILVISEFIKWNDAFLNAKDKSYNPSLHAKYEKFCAQNRSAFDLETWALEYSTIFISLIILGFIIIPTLIFNIPNLKHEYGIILSSGKVIIVSSVIFSICLILGILYIDYDRQNQLKAHSNLKILLLYLLIYKYQDEPESNYFLKANIRIFQNIIKKDMKRDKIWQCLKWNYYKQEVYEKCYEYVLGFFVPENKLVLNIDPISFPFDPEKILEPGYLPD